MSSPYLVADSEIAALFYLKSDRKIADYLGIDEDRVARVREVRGERYPEKPLIARPEPKVELPQAFRDALNKKPEPLSNCLTPDLCPTCGAPVGTRLMVTHIQALVAAYYKIPVREMTSSRRTKDVTGPRQVAMYLSYELTPKSLPDIGQRFGGRDHTTVIHAIKVVQERMVEDAELEADVRALRERLAA